ncbi:MAG: AAA family ATPase [Pirellulales bacterium]|nr:AAA family ATPase [Pirellulales bacterium]
MRIDPQRSSQWMVEMHKQLVRGKQVLLYGNVFDQFLLNEEYVTLTKFLNDYFVAQGYQVSGQYDIVDGLGFARPEMRRQFDRIVKAGRDAAQKEAAQAADPVTGAIGQQPSHSATPPSQSDANSPSEPRANTPAAPPPRSRRSRNASIQPDQMLDAFRHAICQPQVPVGIAIRFSDKLFNDRERHTDSERPLLVLLEKTISQAAYIADGPLQGRRNSLVLIASKLGTIPDRLYQDNPFISLIQVQRPPVEERRTFISRFLENFCDGGSLRQDQVDRVGREFADLTDGLTACDLDAIRRTSVAEEISIASPKVLVDYYKYGRRDDPWEHLDSEKIRHGKESMEQRVIGQPHALDAVERMLISARVGISMTEPTTQSGKPKGVFFFVGPTGVGKTELAKAMTELVFSDETAFARFDMSEYAERHSAEKFTGSAPGYVGYEEGGLLTNRVIQRPFSLLLFDEIEKAHGQIMDKFLQILEDGRLTDGKGQTAYFSQAVIVFTSNIGSSTLPINPEDIPKGRPRYDQIRKHFLDAVRKHFNEELGRPELLNRLGDNVVVFDIIRPDHVEPICHKFLRGLEASARLRHELHLNFEYDSLVGLVQDLMLQEGNILFGGRRVRTLLEDLVQSRLNAWVFEHGPPRGANIKVGVEVNENALSSSRVWFKQE